MSGGHFYVKTDISLEAVHDLELFDSTTVQMSKYKHTTT